jgi:hypothetical protein
VIGGHVVAIHPIEIGSENSEEVQSSIVVAHRTDQRVPEHLKDGRSDGLVIMFQMTAIGDEDIDKLEILFHVDELLLPCPQQVPHHLVNQLKGMLHPIAKQLRDADEGIR